MPTVAILFALVLAWLSSSEPDLYARLELPRTASAREIKKAWYKLALTSHPDKVEGTAADKEAATAKFKRAAEAYEVLSEPTLRSQYDRTGVVPDDKAKTEAHTKSHNAASHDEDEQYGFESDAGQQQHQRAGAGGWNSQRCAQNPGAWGCPMFRFDAFEIGLAQQRAKRVRTLDGLRRLLQSASGARFGLVGFYRRGSEASIKNMLRFPYPFAGWSLAAAGDVLQRE